MSVIEDVKARLDIVSYINQYVPLKKAGKYHKACCPFHAEKTPSFTVSDDQQSWRCFGACSEGGDVFSFAMKYHGWEFKEALTELGKLAGVEVSQQSPEQKQNSERADQLRGLLKEAANAYHKKLFDANDADAQAALNYAHEKRGLSDETIRAFGIGYAPSGWSNITNYLTELGYSEQDVIDAGLALRSERKNTVYDRFRNRFIVPIRDRRGRVVGFGGRILDPDDNPKYLNSPQSAVFDKSHILFGLDLAANAIRDTETAVIVEGYMDAITAHQAGFSNVVAQMGTALTDQQLGLIAPKWAKRIVLALDSDAAGQSATRRSLEVAREALTADYTGRMQVDMRVLQIPDAKDPDDLIREAPETWAKLVANATPVADYVINAEVADLPADAGIQQREAVARRIVPILWATENNLYQKENVQKLAMRLLIPERDLMRIANEQAQIQRARPPRMPQPPQIDEPQPPPRTDFGDAPSIPDEPPPREFNDEADYHGYENEPPPRNYAIEKPVVRKAVKKPPASVQTKLEAHLMNGFLNYPDVYYRVNGKLRECAFQEERLINGPLKAFDASDFTELAIGMLMEIFIEALNQDELEVSTFMLTHTDMSLQDTLELVMVDQLKAKFDEPTVSPGDFRQIMARRTHISALIDPERDLMAQALRLRIRRLMREREEYRLIQTNAIKNGELNEADTCANQIDLLAHAVHLLQLEEQQVSRLY